MQKLRRHPVAHWDDVEKFSQFCIDWSFKSWKNGFFQHVKLLLRRLMFQDILYFLGNLTQEGLYNVCKHNSLWSNTSIGENGLEQVELHSLSVCVERLDTKSYGVLNFCWWVLFGFHSIECVEFERKKSVVVEDLHWWWRICVFKSCVELLLLCYNRGVTIICRG